MRHYRWLVLYCRTYLPATTVVRLIKVFYFPDAVEKVVGLGLFADIRDWGFRIPNSCLSWKRVVVVAVVP